MRKFMRSVLVSALALTAGVAAHAASDTTEFKVRITITESCDISTVAATDVDFLTHARSSAASSIDAQGNLAVTCTKDTPYAIALDMGQNSAGSVASAFAFAVAGTASACCAPPVNWALTSGPALPRGARGAPTRPSTCGP